ADAAARWSLDEVRRARWLLREPGSGTREAVEQALLPHLRGFAQTLQLGNTEAIKQAAIAGLGLACLSRHALEEPLALGRLRVLETPLPALQRTLWLVRHPGKQWLPGLQALLGEVG
ncbi:LysR family transcriptional regulator, partial [Stenotrophomonas maltophilia]